MDYSNPGETKWNIDDARMKSLEFYLEQLEFAFLEWDIEGINKYIRAVIRVILGTGSKSDNDALKKGKEDLEKTKREIDKTNEPSIKKQKEIKFYNLADKLLEEINKQNTTSGVYFRKGKDPTKAAIDM